MAVVRRRLLSAQQQKEQVAVDTKKNVKVALILLAMLGAIYFLTFKMRMRSAFEGVEKSHQDLDLSANEPVETLATPPATQVQWESDASEALKVAESEEFTASEENEASFDNASPDDFEESKEKDILATKAPTAYIANTLHEENSKVRYEEEEPHNFDFDGKEAMGNVSESQSPSSVQKPEEWREEKKEEEEGEELENLNQVHESGVGILFNEDDFKLDLALSSKPFYNANLPGVVGVSLENGTLSNAYKAVKRSDFKSGLELPRIFRRDIKIWKRYAKKKRKVCVFTRTPRQDSLFSTNIMSLFGSGDFNYEIMRSTDCQHKGICETAEQARTHPRCDPDTMPTIHLLERIKNFEHERHEQVLTNGIDYYDVLVATGDEYCRATNTFARSHFRTYHGSQVVNASRRAPMYLPLGTREEFPRVYPLEVKLAKDREYVFNFLGSLSSDSRKELVRELKTKMNGFKQFLHIVPKWGKKLTKQYGYVSPKVYRQVVLNSVFTLCPQGHNPEAYRIYEACEAGSIPIVVLDHHYRSHECQGAFTPLIVQGAPFVFLNGWHELPAFMEMIMQDPARIQRMQADSMAWYSAFMRKVANQFEQVMILRAEDRFDRGRFTSTSQLANIESYVEDPKYIFPLPPDEVYPVPK